MGLRGVGKGEGGLKGWEGGGWTGRKEERGGDG